MAGCSNNANKVSPTVAKNTNEASSTVNATSSDAVDKDNIKTGNNTASTTSLSDSDKSFAWESATYTMKGLLNNPSTAVFPSSHNGEDIKSTAYNTFEVNSYVNAQNNLGTVIRTYFSMTIKRIPETDRTNSFFVGSFKVENLKINGVLAGR